MRITANHPVRRAVSNITTYHNSKGDAVAAILAACDSAGIEAVPSDLDGPDGWATFALRPKNNAYVICDCCAEQSERMFFDNCVAVSWYTMQSGLIELTVYVS